MFARFQERLGQNLPGFRFDMLNSFQGRGEHSSLHSLCFAAIKQIRESLTEIKHLETIKISDRFLHQLNRQSGPLIET